MITVDDIQDKIKKENPDYFIKSSYKTDKAIVCFISNGYDDPLNGLTDGFAAYDIKTGKQIPYSMEQIMSDQKN